MKPLAEAIEQLSAGIATADWTGNERGQREAERDSENMRQRLYAAVSVLHAALTEQLELERLSGAGEKLNLLSIKGVS